MGLVGADPRNVGGEQYCRWVAPWCRWRHCLDGLALHAGRAMIARGIEAGYPGAAARLSVVCAPDAGIARTAAGAPGMPLWVLAHRSLARCQALLPEGSPYRRWRTLAVRWPGAGCRGGRLRARPASITGRSWPDVIGPLRQSGLEDLVGNKLRSHLRSGSIARNLDSSKTPIGRRQSADELSTIGDQGIGRPSAPSIPRR